MTAPTRPQPPTGPAADGMGPDAQALLVGWQRPQDAPTLLSAAPALSRRSGAMAPGAGETRPTQPAPSGATITVPLPAAQQPDVVASAGSRERPARPGRGLARDDVFRRPALPRGRAGVHRVGFGPGLAAAGLGANLRALGAVALALALLFGIAPLSQPGAQAASLRVAIIVGPVGGLTDHYRADAREAAAEARRWTDDVVTVYSPDATWAAARDAMIGASIVVYLGHGNGFPSRYSRTLNPKTQNGLGLNPVAGQGDGAHQYFGEAYLARQVRLAPDAVVILAHLCYASGNSEPGLPEGTLDTARQRVDNFAAGFLAAGAGAVIADAFQDPAYYIRSILAGKGTIERIWRRAPAFHDNVVAFSSERTPGLTALLDPTRPRSQFYRSLVTKADLRADEVARGATRRAGTGTAPATEAAAPTPLPRVGPAVTKAGLRGRPVAGATVELALAFSDSGTEPPGDLEVGVRWVPLETRPAQAAEPAASAATPASPEAAGAITPSAAPDVSSVSTEPSPPVFPGPAASVLPGSAGSDSPGPASPAPAESPPVEAPTPSAVPATNSPTPAASPAPARGAPASGARVLIIPSPPSPEPTPEPAAVAIPAPELPPDPAASLVALEAPGSLVVLAPTKATSKRARVALEVPAEPGLYRLVATLHDGDGVAFDAAAQERVPALLVRVTANLSARVAVAGRVATTAGARLELPVAVLNSGTVPWAEAPTSAAESYEEARTTRAAPPEAFLVGHWLRLDPPGGAPPTEAVRERLVAAPGETGRLALRLLAPELPGTYLLVLDVVSPLRGSLVAAGDDPAIVRVTVGWPLLSPRPDFAPTPEYVPAPALGEPAPGPDASPLLPADPIPPAVPPADPAEAPAAGL